jgi:hypothetical protein
MRRGIMAGLVSGILCAWLGRAEGGAMFGDANTLPLRCEKTNEVCRITAGNAPGFLYLPGERVDLTLEFRAGPDKGPIKDFALEIQGVHTRKPNKTKEYMDPYGYPDVLNLDGTPIRHPLEVTLEEGKATTVMAAGLPVPDRYGTYCVVLTRGDKRYLLGSVSRVMKSREFGTVENTPIFGEGALLSCYARDQSPKMISRLGIRGVRCEISWRANKADGTYDWKEYDGLTADLKAGGVQAMFTLGGVDRSRYGIQTKEWSPVPAAVTTNWNGTPYGGQADWGCDPKYFDQYEAWVKQFCERYWEGGKGALWGLENYNEPWEGGGISGYARDGLSYREWQKRMALAAHAVNKDIRICAASSIMNTEDKLFPEGPDAKGQYEFDRYIDVFTDHYVPPYCAYGAMVAKRHGKFSIENETWLAISEYLLPQIMCQWLAAGQQLVAPFHPAALFDRLGPNEPVNFPTTVPVAVAAFNHFVTGHPFERLVFPEHLPWLFQFGKDDDPEAVCVLLGQLLTRGGPTPQDEPKGRLWAQVDSVDGGTIAIDNADGALRFHDVAGNEILKGRKTVTLDLAILPTYIHSTRGPALVAERVRAARIEGKYPAEILPHDFTQRIADTNLTLRVDVANRLNRPIKGTLRAQAPDGFAVADNDREVRLAAGEKRAVTLRFRKAAASPLNQYPFAFVFDTDAGKCAYSETLNCAVAVKGARKIDGDLSDWDNVPGITLVGEQKGIDPDELARRPWLRLVKDLPGGAVAAELKMAWDEEFLYVAARVSDATSQTNKVRMEGRDENGYFHSAASDNEEPWKTWLKGAVPGSSFAQVPYIYKKQPWDNSYVGDQLQLAFDVIPGWHDLEPTTNRVPYGFHAVPDTDYEFSAYLCADGRSELWNLLTPDMPRIHDWPHQPKGKVTTNPTPGAKHVVKQDGNVRIYEIALPRTRMPELSLQPGRTFKFAFHVGNNQGASIAYGNKKAVTKLNGLALHPYWVPKPSCDVEWALVE